MHMSRNATYFTLSIGAHVFYIKLNKPMNLGIVIEHKLTYTVRRHVLVLPMVKDLKIK